MKRMLKEKTGKVVTSCAKTMTSLNVNSACQYWFYQEKLPEEAKKLRKF